MFKFNNKNTRTPRVFSWSYRFLNISGCFKPLERVLIFIVKQIEIIISKCPPVVETVDYKAGKYSQR